MHTPLEYEQMAQRYYKAIRITYFMDKHRPIKGYLHTEEGLAVLDNGKLIKFRH